MGVPIPDVAEMACVPATTNTVTGKVSLYKSELLPGGSITILKTRK